MSLQFSVCDTGIGIAPEDCQRIFAPFTQADASTTRRFGGSGLGLTISQKLVELMGGRIWATSRIGEGSTFSFTAQLRLQEAAEIQAPNGLPDRKLFRGVRVLVVAGNPALRQFLEETVASWSMCPDVAGDAAEAWTRLKEAAAAGSCHRVVLADCTTSGLDCAELVERMGELQLSAPIILMLPPGHERQRREQFRGLGAVCLDKPVSQSDLLLAIAKALGVDGQPGHEAPIAAVSLPPAPRPLRVLLAEDTQANQKLVTHILSKRGHQVEVAGDGQKALELVQRQQFDVVLMDVQMPIMDGFQVTSAIRQREAGQGSAPDNPLSPFRLPPSTLSNRRLPIIALTAHALKGDHERCLAAGMDGYLSKPIEGRELIEVVERMGTAP